MTVEEPADGSTTAVELVIFRSGTFGQASVLFRISSMSDSFNRTAEVSQTTGIAVIEDGKSDVYCIQNIVCEEYIQYVHVYVHMYIYMYV